MERLSKTGGKAGKPKSRNPSLAKGGKTLKTKGRIAPAVTRKKGISTSELEAQLERQTRELNEVLAQQSAAADVLQLISNSPAELESIFKAVLENATRICDARFGTLLRFDGNAFYFAADVGTPAALADYVRRPGPFQGLSGGMIDRILKTRQMQHSPDYASDTAPGLAAKLGGARSTLGVPILKDNVLIGAIVIYRQEVRPFSIREIDLVRSFATQAAIAIENARTFNESKEALKRQTAMGEILKVIASSPDDVQPVLEAVSERAMSLLDAWSVLVIRFDGEQMHFGAARGSLPDTEQYLRALYPARPDPETNQGRCILERAAINSADAQANPNERIRERARLRGFRAGLVVPMLRDGQPVGAISISRKEAGTFAAHEVELLQTFADQAVIAIENARLFSETQEALEQQTATSDILRVISRSPTDVRPVFEAVVQTAVRLLHCDMAVVLRCDGTNFSPAAAATPEGLRVNITPTNVPIDPDANFPSRVIVKKAMLHLPDYSRIDVPEHERHVQSLTGIKSALFLPMLREDECIGVLALTGKQPRTFRSSEIALAEAFRDQAVIAIENARLFNETKDALERQTSTADILKVIASSPDDVQPVFDAIASSARRLIGGFSTAVHLVIDDMVHLVAFTPTNPESDAILVAAHPRHRSEVAAVALVEHGEIVQIADSETADAHTRQLGRARGWRGLTLTPLMNRRNFVGFIASTRRETGVLGNHHVELLRTFADQAVIAIENARLFKETQEALERQTATADILKVIASSPNDVQPVFQAIAERSNRLVAGLSTAVYSIVDGVQRLMAFTPISAEADAALQAFFPAPLSRFIWGETIRKGEIVRIADSEIEFVAQPAVQEMARMRGWRSLVLIPLLRENTAIGLISVTRADPGSFADHHVELLQTFADQAVIAIQNVQLFNETQEALEQQRASADILTVISNSVADTQPVFEKILQSIEHLFGSEHRHILLLGDDGLLHIGAVHGPNAKQTRKLFPIPAEGTGSELAIRERRILTYADVLNDPDVPIGLRETARRFGKTYSTAIAPMLRGDRAIGAIQVSRLTMEPFTEKECELLRTFADQAVIAIQNARLFNEIKEALERQTATADILKVIASSPDDVQPVFQAIAERANHLLGGHATSVFRFSADTVHLMAFTPVSPEADATLKQSFPRALADSPQLKMVQDGNIVQIPDAFAQDAVAITNARARGFRSLMFMPLSSPSGPIGAISVTRKEAGVFSEHHVQLLQTFADQAVIAISNVGLFQEVQAKTRDLTESLEQQTATTEVLEVISASTGELEPVFQKMLENATRVCGANFGAMTLYDGDQFQSVAHFNTPLAFTPRKFRPHPKSGMAIVARTKQVVQVEDIRTEAPYLERDPAVVAIADIAGARTLVAVPMLRENEMVGAITIFRQEVRPFTDKQVGLVANFAKQAVIAIENTRLLKELRQRTDDLSESLQQQTATAEVLKVISSSPGELDTVFQIMLANGTRICEANFGMMYRYENSRFDPMALLNVPPALAIYIQDRGSFLPLPGTPLDRILQTKDVTYTADETMIEPNGAPARLGGARSLVGVPMLKEDELVGAIIIYRQEVRPFNSKQVALVQNFAAQAVIAIENARLLNELRERTDDLTASLDDLRNAQDRLIQTEKLASLGQLTAGIAHEIKNPLNFVNNFSAVSAELVDELDDTLAPAALDPKMRGNVTELTSMLKSNLEKVVQHGKRADSIVKNMLLHSREGSGEHRSADVNALVEESLNLAYHGARAENSRFNITLTRELDPDAGEVELYPQEITRALLNLISNGFYAATKRKCETGDQNFEPELRAATKNLGNRIEIRIRDNGTGVPAEVKEKMFNPFFTTKPPGEGTGLGLSMCHDIIVKQHSGTIDVETEPGRFTELKIVLPRTIRK